MSSREKGSALIKLMSSDYYDFIIKICELHKSGKILFNFW